VHADFSVRRVEPRHQPTFMPTSRTPSWKSDRSDTSNMSMAGSCNTNSSARPRTAATPYVFPSPPHHVAKDQPWKHLYVVPRTRGASCSWTLATLRETEAQSTHFSSRPAETTPISAPVAKICMFAFNRANSTPPGLALGLGKTRDEAPASPEGPVGCASGQRLAVAARNRNAIWLLCISGKHLNYGVASVLGQSLSTVGLCMAYPKVTHCTQTFVPVLLELRR
jgi:hypothetical protein